MSEKKPIQKDGNGPPRPRPAPPMRPAPPPQKTNAY